MQNLTILRLLLARGGGTHDRVIVRERVDSAKGLVAVGVGEAGRSRLGEHLLPKQRVASSSLVSRSKYDF